MRMKTGPGTERKATVRGTGEAGLRHTTRAGGRDRQRQALTALACLIVMCFSAFLASFSFRSTTTSRIPLS